MRASAFLLIFTTAPDPKTALKISNLLLDQALAACVNLSAPSLSLYRWKGKKERAREVLMVIKTRKSLFPKLQKAILKNHPYEVPEIIAVPLAAGSPSYLSWILKETADS